MSEKGPRQEGLRKDVEGSRTLSAKTEILAPRCEAPEADTNRSSRAGWRNGVRLPELALSSTEAAGPGQARDRDEAEKPDWEAPKVDAESLSLAIPDEKTVRSGRVRLLGSMKDPKWPGSGTNGAGSS